MGVGFVQEPEGVPVIIKCPGCGQSLPATYIKCQFCGADVSGVPRPAQTPDAPNLRSQIKDATWPWPAYRCLVVFWMLSALGGLVMDLAKYRDPSTIAYHGLLLAVGVCLVMRVEIVEKFLPWVCGFQILFGALVLITAAGFIEIQGTAAIIVAAWAGVNVLVHAGIIYITETHDIFLD